MDYASHIRRLLKQVTGSEPADIAKEFAALRPDTVYAGGTTIPLLGATPLRLEPSGLAVSRDFPRGPSPLDYTGVYIVLEDYLEFSNRDLGLEIPTSFLIQFFARQLPRSELLGFLVMLDHCFFHLDDLQYLTEHYPQFWEPVTRARLEVALRKLPGGPAKQFLSRQAILAAMRTVLSLDDPQPTVQRVVPEIVVAVLLVHAVASSLSAEGRESEDMLGASPAHLALEVIQNELFHQPDDTASLIDRQIRLWREFGSQLMRETPRLNPADMLLDATGLEIEDILALGIGLHAHRVQWKNSKPLWFSDDFNSVLPRTQIEKFLSQVSATGEAFHASLGDVSAPWDFMVFHEKPVFRDGNRLLVLDENLLLDRIFNGLYWMVHEHEREIAGEEGWLAWTRVYGEMVELLVEDQLGRMAPRMLSSSDRTYYSEEDFKRAYKGKICDVTIDYGSEACLVEIVSGQLTRGSRFEGSVESFKRDTVKLVLKKVCQLDESARSFLNDPQALTGFSNTPGLPSVRIVPVVVVGGGYPVNPITIQYIASEMMKRNLLDDARIAPLSIIDLSELEMLESVVEQGQSLPAMLRAWHESTLATMPLRNFLIYRYESNANDFRPTRMKESTAKVFDAVIARLQLRS